MQIDLMVVFIDDRYWNQWTVNKIELFIIVKKKLSKIFSISQTRNIVKILTLYCS